MTAKQLKNSILQLAVQGKGGAEFVRRARFCFACENCKEENTRLNIKRRKAL